MTKVARIILAVILLILVAFCVFAFMGTFEPGDRNVLGWRVGFGVVGTASLILAIWVLRLVWADRTTIIND